MLDKLRHAWWETASTFRRWRYANEIRTLNRLALFAPYSSGPFAARVALAMQAADQVFPLLHRLLDVSGRQRLGPARSAVEFCTDDASQAAAIELRRLFNHYGSDKSSTHDYHHVYGRVLAGRSELDRILEIGLGSHHEDVVSNMGRLGKPGASLRAFRDFAPDAQVYGADIDRRVLFEEERIKTFFVDQTELASFDELARQVGTGFDLIIDDGLHTINANLAVMLFALPRLKPGGWIVIEDIAPAAVPAWHVVASLLPAGVECELIQALDALVFVLRKP